MDPEWYPIIKALHIIFMVTFFAGTFYIVRLFIYHKEALAKFEPDRGILSKQLALMERKLWYIITWPSLVLMTLFGTWMLVMQPSLLQQPWMHAKLTIDGEIIMASDAPPGQYHQPQGYSVSLTVEDVADGERKFKALAEGGSVNMPYSKTFWAKGFGMCVDQFGIPWMVNCPAEGM
jgi:uncharacterized integral membrane protein (TIGR00701 family)